MYERVQLQLPTKKWSKSLDRLQDRGRIGRYAAENGNIAALKRFKSEHKDLVESTVRTFKKKYLAAVAEKRAAQDYMEVSAISSLKHEVDH